jgi:spore germination cell wall hydrolase CwlJ-like protein
LSITFEPRAGDARALAVSLGLVALIGVAIGGAYIAGGIAREAVSKPLLAQADHVQIPTPTSNGAQSAANPVFDPALQGQALQGFSAANATGSPAASLRDRFSVALSLTRSVVQPFHFHSADAAAGDHARDTQCLAQAVYYEARGESPSGQAAVAQVVLNRVRHPAFPKTICGVVFQHVGDDCQFSFACNGAMREPLDRASWRRATLVADRALSGAVMAEVGAATHFQAARSTSGWAGSLAKVAQIGEHIFYRFTGRAGTPRMFHAEPQRSGPDAPTQIDAEAGRVRTSFTVAMAAPAPDAKPKAADLKGAAASTAAPAMAKAVEPSAGTSTASSAPPSAQPLKAAEPETSKPITAAATQS